jgi:hypothetical protein
MPKRSPFSEPHRSGASNFTINPAPASRCSAVAGYRERYAIPAQSA